MRTLHHYDELGLLSPSGRSEAGCRLYSPEDLARLHEILIWRTLGFPLTEIGALLDDPGHDRLAALDLEVETMFEGFDPSQYEEEARERWGGTEAYRGQRRGLAGQSLSATWPGWAATRSSQSRIAG